MPIRTVGTCQVCEAQQKLQPGGTLVLHGYRRPGYGSVEGRCPGAHHRPWEVAHELVDRHAAAVRDAIVVAQRIVDDLQDGKVVTITRRERKYDPSSGHYRDVEVALERDEMEPSAWRREVQRSLQTAANDLSRLRDDLRHAERRLATWAPSRVQTFEEAQAAARATLQPARDAKAAAKAEKLARQEASRAKAAALDDLRWANTERYKQQFLALDAEPATPERAVRAAKLARLYVKDKTQMIVAMRIDPVLGRLGLTTTVGPFTEYVGFYPPR